MSTDLTHLQNDVISRLNEALDTPAGALMTGGGSSAVVTNYATLDTITLYLNQGAAEIARTCWPISDTATFSWQSGVRVVPLEGFSSVSGGVVWHVSDVVSYGSGTVPYRARRSAVQTYDNGWMSTQGTPTLWYPDGEGSIGLYPIPSAGATATVNCFVLPPLLVNGSNTVVSWFPDDLCRIMVFYAAWQIADRNTNDPSLAALSPVFLQKFQAGISLLQTELVARDKGLALELGITLAARSN